jgi:hypothetical protein
LGRGIMVGAGSMMAFSLLRSCCRPRNYH